MFLFMNTAIHTEPAVRLLHTGNSWVENSQWRLPYLLMLSWLFSVPTDKKIGLSHEGDLAT